MRLARVFEKALRAYGRTDGPTDGRTDRPSYRDARTHLKRDSKDELLYLRIIIVADECKN